MPTYLRSHEAAQRLGVSTSTLYAYVSRGRIPRIAAADGRASLFDAADVDALAQRGRARRSGPPPTIDVRITSDITQLGEADLRFHRRSVADLVERPFESVAEFLWTGSLPRRRPTWSGRAGERRWTDGLGITDLIRIATDEMGSDADEANDAAAVARSILTAIPGADGTTYAERVTHIWARRPTPELVSAVNAALVLLADHGLATSTLAVRVAGSVRSTPAAAIVAGLASVQGRLHGSAMELTNGFFAEVADEGGAAAAADVVAAYRAAGRRVPGFGHSVYRQRDPRFELMMGRVRRLPDPTDRLALVDSTIAAGGAAIVAPPNIDLALGALTFVSGLPAAAPIFAIARIAGWAAHYLEELDEPPIRFRGVASPKTGHPVEH